METIIILCFLAGYVAISFEHTLRINKSAIALLTGIVCWVLYVWATPDKALVVNVLNMHLSGIASVVFFLIGAMTIVELIDLHNGFDFISAWIYNSNKTKLLWTVALITFFLSSVLDNLTATIVMISIARKLVNEKSDRLFYAGIIVIAANAGGVWSPIGDVTTTMLWMGNQITTSNIIKMLFLPGIVSLIVPLLLVSKRVKGTLPVLHKTKPTQSALKRSIPFVAGMTMLLFVPVFKVVTHLPPFMGMLFSLAIIWVVSEIVDHRKDTLNKGTRSVASALRKIDITSILFFTGILLSVAALDASGILHGLATSLQHYFKNVHMIAFLIGLSSSVFDNVPLVAATMGMFDISVYPTDHSLWEFIAYCSGTGGSIFIIGSAAGVAAMGVAEINFFWYLKNIAWLALLGYLAGAAVYMLQISRL